VRRELSTRSLALIALGLAVASGVFCWQWASRYSAAIARHDREVLSLQLQHNKLEHLMLNIRTLLFINPATFMQSRRAIAPPAPESLQEQDIGSSPTLEAPERAQAQQLFDRYSKEMWP